MSAAVTVRRYVPCPWSMCSPVTWDDSRSGCNEIERAMRHAIYDLPRRDRSGETDTDATDGSGLAVNGSCRSRCSPH